jgi:hypothetical protein
MAFFIGGKTVFLETVHIRHGIPEAGVEMDEIVEFFGEHEEAPA